ncbi:metal-sensitive transcriptional regulator [Candidatus Marinamargulisbacteria bacterium SCGC AG-439-L15]|nr:metal-sensitive transcriptional regulator [Candidatus Marinamargulisbacteria bacterium SCGC AG-439-L15]
MVVSQFVIKSKKEEVTEKLKRIEGRVRGLSRMVEDERDCVDILTQLSSTYESLRVVSKSIIRQFLEQRISSGLMSTNTHRRDEAYDEVLDVLYKYVK